MIRDVGGLALGARRGGRPTFQGIARRQQLVNGDRLPDVLEAVFPGENVISRDSGPDLVIDNG